MEPQQQIQSMMQMIQDLRPSQERLEALRQSQAGVQVIASSVESIAKALETKREEKRKILIDTKGLGRPEAFDNKEDSFRRWARSIETLMASVYGTEYTAVLEQVLDSESEVLVSDLETAFGSGTVEDIKDLGSAADQLHRILQTLTTGESEDLVGRRWDPRTAGRKRNMLRVILNPERCKTWNTVRGAIEQLEDLIRRYEARKNGRIQTKDQR